MQWNRNFFTSGVLFSATCFSMSRAVFAFTSRKREAEKLQTKGKKLRTMAIILKDRNEKVTLNGSVYELTLLWNREDIRRCCFGMPPEYAHIRKDGRNFATIDCYSSLKGFRVDEFHRVFVKPEWKVLFGDKDINTIPFMDILQSLPLQDSNL